MPRTALSAASASRTKCGCRREAGKARTSATLRTPALARSAKKSSAARFECPTEYTTGVTPHHARAAAYVASTPVLGYWLVLTYRPESDHRADLREDFAGSNWPALTKDGLHPTRSGNARISAFVASLIPDPT